MADHHIPMLDLAAEARERGEEFLSAIRRVLESGRYILGPEVDGLEAELSEYVGKPTVTVASGTDALVLGLRALDIGPGDEVITSPFSFVATASAILHAGATPVFCDIQDASFNLDPTEVAKAITPATRALLPVHLFGHAADVRSFRRLADEHGLLVIEDAAQALGGTYDGQYLGGLGDVAALSFFPAKNLGAFGDGGAVVTRNDEIAERVRVLRSHGSRRKYHNEILGYNSRLDALQAAVLRVKLRYLELDLGRRRRVAQRYFEALADEEAIILPSVAAGVGHAWQQFTVRVPGGQRDEVATALAAHGIASMVYYPVPLHAMPLFQRYGRSLPCAERAAAEVLSLPMGPQLDETDQHRIVEAFRATLRETSRTSR